MRIGLARRLWYPRRFCKEPRLVTGHPALHSLQKRRKETRQPSERCARSPPQHRLRGVSRSKAGLVCTSRGRAGTSRLQHPSAVGCSVSEQLQGFRGLRRATRVSRVISDRAPSGPSERPTPQLRDFGKAAAGGERRRSGTHHRGLRGREDSSQGPVHPGGLRYCVNRWSIEGWRHIGLNRAFLGGR